MINASYIHKIYTILISIVFAIHWYSQTKSKTDLTIFNLVLKFQVAAKMLLDETVVHSVICQLLNVDSGLTFSHL